VRHVISENLRVEAAVEALRSDDLEKVGELIDASHASLRDDFEVSSPELDIMAEICRSQPEILGSRMIGGGFGGCAVGIAREEADLEAAGQTIAEKFTRQTGIEPAIYTCRSMGGAGEI
jgi:galactokinase